MRCILGAECCFRSAGREAGAGDGGSGKPASDFGRADRRRRGRLPRDTGGGIAVGNGVGNRTGSAGAPGMRGLCRFGDDSWRGCMPVVRRGGTVRGCGAVGCEGDFFGSMRRRFAKFVRKGRLRARRARRSESGNPEAAREDGVRPGSRMRRRSEGAVSTFGSRGRPGRRLRPGGRSSVGRMRQGAGAGRAVRAADRKADGRKEDAGCG